MAKVILFFCAHFHNMTGRLKKIYLIEKEYCQATKKCYFCNRKVIL